MPPRLLFFCLGLLVAGSAFSAPAVSEPAWEIPCSSTPWRSVPAKPFQVGEKIDYVIRWGALHAGRATISVDGLETVHGRPAYHVSMDLGTTGMTGMIHQYHERTDTWIDHESLLPVRYTKETREGSYARDEAVVLDQACGRYERFEHRIDKGTEGRRQGRLPPGTVDILGYLFYLRALPLAVGENYELTLLSGEDLWPVTVEVLRRTKISGPAGWQDTYFLQPRLRAGSPQTKLRELQVWVTADERRVPARLRMEVKVGSILAEMLPSK